MDRKVLKIDLSTAKAVVAVEKLEKVYIEPFRQVAKSALPRHMLTKDEVIGMVNMYSDVSEEIDNLVIAHSVFFSIAISMQEVVDEYALASVKDKMFPRQIEGMKSLIKFVRALNEYYKSSNDNNR